MHAYILHRLLVEFLFCFEVGMNGPALSCRFDDPLEEKGMKGGGEPAFKQRQIFGWLTNHSFIFLTIILMRAEPTMNLIIGEHVHQIPTIWASITSLPYIT